MELEEAIKHIEDFFIDFPCEEDNTAIAIVLEAARKQLKKEKKESAPYVLNHVEIGGISNALNAGFSLTHAYTYGGYNKVFGSYAKFVKAWKEIDNG